MAAAEPCAPRRTPSSNLPTTCLCYVSGGGAQAHRAQDSARNEKRKENEDGENEDEKWGSKKMLALPACGSWRKSFCGNPSNTFLFECRLGLKSLTQQEAFFKRDKQVRASRRGGGGRRAAMERAAPPRQQHRGGGGGGGGGGGETAPSSSSSSSRRGAVRYRTVHHNTVGDVLRERQGWVETEAEVRKQFVCSRVASLLSVRVCDAVLCVLTSLRAHARACVCVCVYEGGDGGARVCTRVLARC